MNGTILERRALVESAQNIGDDQCTCNGTKKSKDGAEHGQVNIFVIWFERQHCVQLVQLLLDLKKLIVDFLKPGFDLLKATINLLELSVYLLETALNIFKLPIYLLKPGFHAVAHGFDHLFERLKLVFGHNHLSVDPIECNVNITHKQGLFL